jgi:phosphoribosylformylglycinamidine cyclo-ligase
MGARPITFLDYIANDKLNPTIIKEIVSGMVKACNDNNVSLVGGETAEMPDTYLQGEHDLVGVITGVVEKNKIINGELISPGDVVLGLPSSGLHTNGYSLARKIFFDIGNYDVKDRPNGLASSVGLTLLEPHINYTNDIFTLLDQGVNVKGLAHITGGGLLENIPRILPKNCEAKIKLGTWDILPVFNAMQSIGNIEQNEMFRTFNMGIGMIIIVSKNEVAMVEDLICVKEIGEIEEGKRGVRIIQ